MPQLPVVPFFLGFFALMGIAIAAGRRPAAQRLGVAVLLGLLWLHGLGGRSTWPFFSWHLYAYRADPELSFHELRVVDAAGTELPYDARAIPPSLPTPLRRLAARLPELPGERSAELARFLLDAAASLRQRRLAGERVSCPLAFPPHQYGHRWTREALAATGPFQGLAVHEVRIRLSEDGRDVLQREDRRVWSWSPR